MAGINILYVEDDQRAAEEVQELARSNGDTLIWESTGSAGLLRAGRDRFDVIILDRMLPDLDGMTILKRLRESGVGTPVTPGRQRKIVPPLVSSSRLAAT